MNQVKAGVVLNYVIIALNTIVGLAYTPYMLRCLGQNEYGLYSLVASVIAYLTILDLGFGNAIVRYTAKFRAEGKAKEQWDMFGMFIIVYTIIGIITLIVGIFLYFKVDVLFDKTMNIHEISQARTMILLLVFNLAITFPFSIFSSIITAYENFIFHKLVSIVRLLLCTVVIVVLLYFGYKAVAMVVVQTIFNVLTLFLNSWYCFQKIGIKIHFAKFNIPFLKEISIYSFWIFLNTIMDRIYWGTGQFVLGAISGTIAVAVFSVAITLQAMYMTFSSSISTVLLPRITSMVAQNASNKEMSNLFISTGRLQAIVLFFILSGFTIFGQTFIEFWAGDGYDQSFIVTMIFFVALFIPLVQNTGIAILQARNQMKFRSLVYLVISIISLMCQIIFSKMYGVIGCAMAIGLALIVGQGLIMNVYYSVKQHISMFRFWAEIGKMSIAPLCMTILGSLIFRYFSFTSPLSYITAIVCYTCLYWPIFWIVSMNKYEKNLVLSPINKLLKKAI